MYVYKLSSIYISKSQEYPAVFGGQGRSPTPGGGDLPMVPMVPPVLSGHLKHGKSLGKNLVIVVLWGLVQLLWHFMRLYCSYSGFMGFSASF